jgi:tetratricopeptide (TPR) repeat protein
MTDRQDEKRLEKAIREGSERFDDYFKLGEFYYLTGRFEKLVELYDQALQLPLSQDELVTIHYERAEALHKIRRFDEAVKSYRFALERISPENDYSIYIKGLIHYALFVLVSDEKEKNQHAAGTLGCLNPIVEIDADFKDNYLLYYTLADTYSRLGDCETALGFFRGALNEASEKTDRVSVLNEMAYVYLSLEEYHEAGKYYGNALREAKGAMPLFRIHFNMARNYFQGGCMAEAAKAFRIALECKKDDPSSKDNVEYELEAFWHLGAIAFKRSNFKDVPRYFNMVLDKIDEHHYLYDSTHLYLAHYYVINLEAERAIDHYRFVILAPLAPRHNVDIAMSYLDRLLAGAKTPPVSQVVH